MRVDANRHLAGLPDAEDHVVEWLDLELRFPGEVRMSVLHAAMTSTSGLRGLLGDDQYEQVRDRLTTRNTAPLAEAIAECYGLRTEG